jgi:hypothetical protein
VKEKEKRKWKRKKKKGVTDEAKAVSSAMAQFQTRKKSARTTPHLGDTAKTLGTRSRNSGRSFQHCKKTAQLWLFSVVFLLDLETQTLTCHVAQIEILSLPSHAVFPCRFQK